VSVELGRAPAVEAAVDTDYLRRIVDRLASIGSSPLGFRVAGTVEDAETAAYVAEELHALGLADVHLEAVPADAWRFHGAQLEAAGRTFTCASFGGAPPTPPSGLDAELVDGGRGRRDDLARRDVRGKIVLVDWRGDQLLWPSLLAAEAAHHGAVAIVCACLEGGRYYQEDGALGSFDALWVPEAAPLATLAKEDAHVLLAALGRGPVRARVSIRADLERSATAWNVLGTLPGRVDGPPVFVAGHHDAWFYGAIDDATGVAATLAIAKAMRDAGHVPERSILFGSHTAEEYGLADSPFDWLIGAWWQVAHTHPEWREGLGLYVNVEGAGFQRPLQVDTPPELRRFVHRIARGARRDGLLPHGVVYGPARSATELWPVVASGIPGISVQSAVTTYATHHYHTPYDAFDLVDFENLALMTRVYARFVVAADRSPESLLDARARTHELRRSGSLDAAAAAGVETKRLDRALARYEEAAGRGARGGRRAFALLAPRLEALNARDKQSRLHVQALRDVEWLDAALAALEREEPRRAARALARVGRNALARDLSREVFHIDRVRHEAGHPRLAWGATANLTQSPDLWDELAALRGEVNADGWLVASLREKRARAADELEHRVEATAAAFEDAAAELDA
jgi:Iap family predicted aminopeptidase